MHFLEKKTFIFDQNFISLLSSWGSNWHQASIGSVNSLNLNREQAITWTDAVNEPLSETMTDNPVISTIKSLI